MATFTPKAEILVLGIGNTLLRDEGIGVHVIRFLQNCSIPDNVELLDGGTYGFDLLDIICDRKAVILIDAVDVGNPPGTVVCFTSQDILPANVSPISAHNIDFDQVMKMASLLQCAPKKVIIYGIQPASIEAGLLLSPDIATVVPKIASLVIDQLNDLLRSADWKMTET